MRLLIAARWSLLGALAVAACGRSTDSDDPRAGQGGSAGGGHGGMSASSGNGTQGSSGGQAGSGVSGGTPGGGTSSGGFGGTGGTDATGGADSAGAGGASDGEHRFRAPPLVFAPNAHGFGVNVVLNSGAPQALELRVREAGTEAEFTPVAISRFESDFVEWMVDGLAPGTRYEYIVLAPSADEPVTLAEGIALTEREAGASFSFALVSDTHIGADLTYTNQGDEVTMSGISREIAATSPDFLVNLGDILDFHEYGFNVPPPDGSITRSAYLNYRAAFGTTLSYAAHYSVLGGWDSENGCNTIDEIERSRQERLRYLPGPRPDTYPEGGSPFEDYYAFTWGDAQFVVLNVYTYTPGCHLLNNYPGLVDDWTLGDAQMEWLRTTLENSTSKWKFLLIHHPVGGDAGDPAVDPVTAEVNSAYGRGGGRAAHVAEQEVVHQLMQDHGVQVFFYGHDHVFTDMTVDDIHYSLPGSAGAIWFFTELETGYSEFWSTSGWAKVDVTPSNVHVQFLALGGEVLYEYTLE